MLCSVMVMTLVDLTCTRMTNRKVACAGACALACDWMDLGGTLRQSHRAHRPILLQLQHYLLTPSIQPT